MPPVSAKHTVLFRVVSYPCIRHIKPLNLNCLHAIQGLTMPNFLMLEWLTRASGRSMQRDGEGIPMTVWDRSEALSIGGTPAPGDGYTAPTQPACSESHIPCACFPLVRQKIPFRHHGRYIQMARFRWLFLGEWGDCPLLAVF